jgi:transposase
VLHGNWKTATFIAAHRDDRVTAPFILEGAMNGETFRAYVEQIAALTLKRGESVAGEAIERRGAILVNLPAYSPDLNPIEQMFSKLKSVLRKVASDTQKAPPTPRDALHDDLRLP